MLTTFFAAAMVAPGRQLTFRRLVVVHVSLVGILTYATIAGNSPERLTAVAYLLLVLGIVEGAALIGWRLTQMPKNQALEFLLTSPVRPMELFAGEALVGIGRFLLIWFAGVPVIGGLVFAGTVDPPDLLPLAVMPVVWGIVAGLGLTAWIYEPVAVRRIGELLSLLGVLVYLVVGVIAGEHLLLWLQALPESVGSFLYQAVTFFHEMNPFGVVRYWFTGDRVDAIAMERFVGLQAFAVGVIGFVYVRASSRLAGHFHDRHYRPIDSSRASQLERIGDRPLSWWAVRRVMEYSGRVNLWLAGGFSLAYAAYLVAGDAWPTWMGRLVFQLFETWGGAPLIATALAVMAAVPAAFQYGLWDATAADRCRRLELLLLTDLAPGDYWHASLSASWKRGRGYLFAAIMLWVALGISGRNGWDEVLAAAAGGALLWAFSFAVGFRAFATGNGGSGLASLLTLGMPMVLVGFLKLGWTEAAAFIPSGLCYIPLADGVSLWWAAGVGLTGFATSVLIRRGLSRCDADLRRWYDRNQGSKAAE